MAPLIVAQLAALVLGVCTTGSTRTCKVTGCQKGTQTCAVDREWAPCTCGCDDFDACTLDVPSLEGCLHTLIPVDDGNRCTIDSCDPVIGPVHDPAPPASSCSDDDYCNGFETCDGAGTCLAELPPSTDDQNFCTADRCDPATGIWNDPLPAGASCSDGNVCNGAEVCDGAKQCVAAAPPSLDDENPCTADACTSASGITHVPVAAGTSCLDGNACDGAETCDGIGACVSGMPPAVDDGNPCTADACDPVLGVVHTSVAGGTSCSDGNVCNGEETCSADARCLSGTQPSLDDGNACTADSCAHRPREQDDDLRV